MNVLGTGLSGLVGSRVVEQLTPSYTFTDLSLSTGVDITDKDAVRKKVIHSDASWIFHFAAKTDVDGNERDRNLGEEGPAWQINVKATENLVNLCRETNKHLLYISTDYVFEGKADFYTETDIPNPSGWYGRTKYEGELRVATLGKFGLIIRIANPFRTSYSDKFDFVRKIIDRLMRGERVAAPVDQLFTPTFIDDLAGAISVLVSRQAYGIYHAVGNQSLSPFEAACKIAREFRLNSRC